MSQIRKSSSIGPSGAVYDFGQYHARALSASAQAVDASDKAGISHSARQLARARAEVDAAPEVRTALIQQLKQSIADGTYNPDPRDIARSILQRGL